MLTAPKVVAGRGGERVSIRVRLCVQEQRSTNKADYLVSSKQVTKSNELSEQRRASRSAAPTPGTARTAREEWPSHLL